MNKYHNTKLPYITQSTQLTESSISLGISGEQVRTHKGDTQPSTPHPNAPVPHQLVCRTSSHRREQVHILGQLDGVHPFRDFQLPGPGTRTARKAQFRSLHELYPNSLLSAQVYITRSPMCPRRGKTLKLKHNPGLMQKEWTPHNLQQASPARKRKARGPRAPTQSHSLFEEGYLEL